MLVIEKIINANLRDALADIVYQIEIKSDFSICHPLYKPLEIDEEARERFQKLPEPMQQKYLGLQLRGFLYGIYYNGSLKASLALDTDAQNLPQDLENNTVLGMDVAFYEQLDQSNKGSGYFDAGWQVLREETDGSLAVTKGGLRLHIQRDKHLQPEQKMAVVGDRVKIKLPKNRVQSGFYMAVGNEGFSRAEETQLPDATVRVYFNFSPDGAAAVMACVTEQLNERKIPFSFKVLYNPKDYQRHDSGVLYFDKQDYQTVREILAAIYQETQTYFKPEIPLFTLELAKGLGLAEEPAHRFSEQESFGTHRCQIIANGLLAAWYQSDNSPEGRMKAILEQFAGLGIDLERPYLNGGSEDVYL
ncbi:T3SS effector HopA1 family protein [Gloeothece verrucosa]|uniref:Uncharacterized protein n=1 Tax=Gloeothece verrucosa (strain PCC 7822) TaxID=497965 RepID=E0UHS6_GLOV7|nr:T3SS effector HopA1 family protein [Gloeothece verrucosa]ADN13333.1 conserved hypothetical protein [Gloeothece verrucosa PCC 7822]